MYGHVFLTLLAAFLWAGSVVVAKPLNVILSGGKVSWSNAKNGLKLKMPKPADEKAMTTIFKITL